MIEKRDRGGATGDKDRARGLRVREDRRSFGEWPSDGVVKNSLVPAGANGEWLRSSFSTWTIPPSVNAFVTRGVKRL